MELFWHGYFICRRVAEAYVGTAMTWPLWSAIWDFAYWLAGFIV